MICAHFPLIARRQAIVATETSTRGMPASSAHRSLLQPGPPRSFTRRLTRSITTETNAARPRRAGGRRLEAANTRVHQPLSRQHPAGGQRTARRSKGGRQHHRVLDIGCRSCVGRDIRCRSLRAPRTEPGSYCRTHDICRGRNSTSSPARPAALRSSLHSFTLSHGFYWCQP